MEGFASMPLFKSDGKRLMPLIASRTNTGERIAHQLVIAQRLLRRDERVCISLVALRPVDTYAAAFVSDVTRFHVDDACSWPLAL